MPRPPASPRSNRRVSLAYASLLALFSVMLACSLPNVIRGTTPLPIATQTLTPTRAAPTATPRPLPPALVESDPPPGAILPLDKPITLYFNQPMQHASVEQALRLETLPAGTFTWKDDATLVFSPSEPLTPDSDLTLDLGASMQSASGLDLAQPVSLSYRTAGYLDLVQALPAAEAPDVDPSAAVVAAFNRPVVPLGADPASLPVAFSLEPAAQGRGEWVNTSTYIFYPSPALAGGKVYTVRLNPDLRSTDGSPLKGPERSDHLPYEWGFTTLSPRLVSMDPPAGTLSMRLDGAIRLTFNQAMDRASVESGFHLLTPGSAAVPGVTAWDEDFTTFTFTPTARLARGTEYTVQLDRQVQAAGGTPLGSALSATVRTVPDLGLVGSDPVSGGQKRPYASVSLFFTGPLADGIENRLEQYFIFNPPVTNLTGYWNADNLSLNLSGDFDPSATYTLRIAGQLPDPWGGTLGQDYDLTFSTAPLDPQLLVTTGTGVFFLTPQDASLPVQATNISQIPIARGSLTLENALAMLGPNGYDLRQSFQAADQQSWTQKFSLTLNRSQAVDLFVSPDQQPLAPGLYYLRLSPQQQNIYGGPFILVVSNLQLTLKISPTEALVWAVDLRSSAPVANAPVSVYDENGNPLASGQTDLQGIFRASLGPLTEPFAGYSAVVGQPGQDAFGMALSNWNEGVAGWNFGITTEFSPPRLQAYLYTDRPIYRPGQTVYFRAVARQVYNGRYTPAGIASLPLTIYDQNGGELTTLDLPLTAFGTAHGQFTLSADAQPGYYRIDSKQADYHTSLSFQVANYRKPEINLQVTFASPQARLGEHLSASIEARYFFDAPSGGLPVEWRLYAAPAYFDVPGYQVGPLDTRWMQAFILPEMFSPLGQQTASGQGRTDAQGRLVLDLPTDPGEAPKTYTLEATAVDESKLPVSSRASLLLNPAAFYIAVRPDAWVARAGEPAGFDVQVVDWDKRPAGEHALLADFSKVVWERSDPFSASPYGEPTYTARYTAVGSANFNTDLNGQARLAFEPPEPGTYQLTLSGEGAKTELLLWVGGPGQAIWPNLPNQRLRLTADRESYLPGETAQLFIPNPFGVPVQALLTVERGTILRHQVLSLEAGGVALDLPLEAVDAPNVYVSVTVLGWDPRGRPDFRQGYLNLHVDPRDQVLEVSLASQPQRAGPGEDVTFTLQVRDASGQPVQGEFSLSVVDRAVLALADPNAPDIVPAFYGDQPLGVNTGLDLAAYPFRQLYAPPGLGGGGGEAIPEVREEFPDTAYWNAEIVTDAAGQAQVSVPLPDSLTTWQVLVRGVTTDTRVGQAEIDLVTTKDLLVRPVTPRFLVVNDHALLAAVVQNNTASALQTTLSLAATGFQLDDPANAAQRVEVPAGGRSRVEWWGTAQDVEAVDLVFSAEAGDLKDAARPTGGALPVRRYASPQTFATSGILDAGGESLELVSLPRTYTPTGGSLRVELAPSLAASMLSGLDVLEHLPYATTEGILSSFLPNLEAYRAMQALGFQSPDLQARLERTLNDGLARLMARQNFDGGWGWWQGGESDVYMTAYVIFGLGRARQAGVTVSETAIQKAVDYLRAGLAAPEALASAPEAGWQLDRLAFEHFVLAQVDAGDPAAAAALYAVHEQLNPWARALLALTLEKLDPGSAPAGTLFSDLQTQAIRSATGAHWEDTSPSWANLSTPVSTSAIVIYALAQDPAGDPNSPLLADAVRYLGAHRAANGGWDSTYSTAWTILALTEVLKRTEEIASLQSGGYSFGALLNGIQVASGQAGEAGAPVTAQVPLSSLYPLAPNALIIQRSTGPGRLYYTAALRADQPVESVSPLDKGFSLSRAYYPAACPQEGCAALASARSGDQVQVRLTLNLSQDAYYLLVEDYLPAGAEVLNANLKTTQLGGEQPAPDFDPRQPFSRGWGWWLFTDPSIYDDHIAWSADFLPAGTYELTYTLVLLQPGEYRVLPARAWMNYFPEVQGSSAGALFKIEP
jgi:uncharacterized protein YfaS (alpha-2-macroglobulin family)